MNNWLSSDYEWNMCCLVNQRIFCLYNMPKHGLYIKKTCVNAIFNLWTLVPLRLLFIVLNWGISVYDFRIRISNVMNHGSMKEKWVAIIVSVSYCGLVDMDNWPIIKNLEYENIIDWVFSFNLTEHTCVVWVELFTSGSSSSIKSGTSSPTSFSLSLTPSMWSCTLLKLSSNTSQSRQGSESVSAFPSGSGLPQRRESRWPVKKLCLIYLKPKNDWRTEKRLSIGGPLNSVSG